KAEPKEVLPPEPTLSPAEIERLAQALFKIGVKALFVEETKNELEKILNQQTPQANIKPAHKPQEIITDNRLKDNLNEQTEQVTENIHDEIVFEITEPSSEETGKAEPELGLEWSSELPDNNQEEKDFLLTTDEGKDALFEGGCEIGLTEEGGSVEITSTNHSNRNRLNEQPSSVIAVFLDEIKNQIVQLQKSTNLLTQDFKDREQWQCCEKIFNQIAANAMIYGFEAFEQIALKAREYITTVLNKLDDISQSAVASLSETKRVLSSILEGDLDNVDDKMIAELLKKLLKSKRELSEIKLKSVDNGHGNSKNDSEQEAPDEDNLNQTQNNNLNLDDPNFEIFNFKLPGEDDEEIMNLVSEISNSESRDKSKAPIAVKSNVSDAIESRNVNANPAIDNEESANGEPKVVTPDSEEPVNLFKKQAEMHYNIIEAALNKLQTEPGEKTALEDLELASNSLYGLTLKLNLEYLSKIPATIEEFIGKIITTKSALAENEYQIIKNVYQQFRDFNCLDAQSRECQELRALIHKLNWARLEKMQSDAKNTEHSKVTQKDIPEDLQIV
ncbi:MAG: hypothetical protein ACE5HX_15005, partial [bacterium]